MLTVFTPSYNRANCLPRLYDSLKQQTNNNFEWLIVDDGSVDETEIMVREWIKEGIINIRYIYQENGGKARAFNNGVKNAKGELFFCVDSDDYLPNDSVELILDKWNIVDDDKIAGIIGLKENEKGELLCDIFPDEFVATTTYDLVRKYGVKGEKSLIYKTEVLKQFPYPEIEGEKFVGENIVYDRIDAEYKLVLLSKVLTTCEYQEGGLTATVFSTMLKNPTGYKLYYTQRIDMALEFKERANYIIRYNAFDILSKDREYDYKGKYKILVYVLRPFGWMLSRYYKSK